MKNKLCYSVVFGTLFAVLSTQAVEDKAKEQEPGFVYKTMPANKTLSGKAIRYKVFTESGKKSFIEGYKEKNYPFDVFMTEIEYNAAQFDKRMEKVRFEMRQYKKYKFDDYMGLANNSLKNAIDLEESAYTNCSNIEIIEAVLNGLHKAQYVNKTARSGKLYSSYYDYATMEATAVTTYNLYN
jgi:hypothetical protein